MVKKSAQVHSLTLPGVGGGVILTSAAEKITLTKKGKKRDFFYFFRDQIFKTDVLGEKNSFHPYRGGHAHRFLDTLSKKNHKSGGGSIWPPLPNLPPKGAKCEKCMSNTSLYSNQYILGEKIMKYLFPLNFWDILKSGIFFHTNWVKVTRKFKIGF